MTEFFVSLYTVPSDDKDEFKESEAIQIITGSDSSVTEANIISIRFTLPFGL